MSSSPTGLTSTTGSSSSCSSRGDGGGADDARGRPVAVIACGALGGHLREIAGRRGWDVEIVCLPSMLHNSPRQIAPEVERLALDLQAAGKRVVLGYADCGTYGELDGLCDRLGLTRLPGLHCYDVLAGPDRIRAALEAEPGTYLLTDFLVRSFRYSVLVPLGLARAVARTWTGRPGRGGGGDVRPAAHGSRRRHRPLGTRTRVAPHRRRRGRREPGIRTSHSSLSFHTSPTGAVVSPGAIRLMGTGLRVPGSGLRHIAPLLHKARYEV